MKNALILFAFVLPLLILQQFTELKQSEFLSSLILVLPAFVFHRLLIKTHSDYQKNEVFGKVFKSAITTGVFYSLWMGSFIYFVAYFWKPEIFSENIKIAHEVMKLQKMSQTEKDTFLKTMISFINSPFHYIFGALLTYSFIFSLLGIILGFIFKLKAANQ
jgi:hypothetical protein